MTAEEDVVRAVMAVCDPSTSNQQRMECTKALEEFRHSSPPDLVSSVGFALIGKNDETLCFIGWNIIEDVIKLKWNDVPVEFRLEMRTKIMEILQRGLAESMVDSLSKTIVAMMEHEWPQNWSELIPQLVQLSQISSVHCTAVFAVLRRLVENVVTLMTIQNAQRRRDMHTGITLYMADIIKMALDQLDQLPGTASDQSGYRTITYILGWLVETCEWVPSVAISTHLNRMVDSLIRHLNTPEKNIYELASRSLAALAERKKETSEECIVVSAFFRTEIIETILQTVRLAGESSETNGAHYRYLKALCGLLTSLGSHLAKVWSEKVPPENYSTYLSALCQIFSHPSLHLKLEALESLVYLSNHEVLGKSDVFHTELEIVLRGMLSALEKTGYPSQKPVTQAVHYSNMDYDDDVEWSNDLKKLRERARVLLIFSLERHFPLLIEILDRCVFQEVANKYLALDPVRWEPMQIFSKVVVQCGFDKELFTESSRDAMMAMGDALVQLMRPISNWDLLSGILSVHSSLLPIYRYHACGLNNYMDLLQWCLLSSNCHTSLNRHVISLILRAVTLFPDFFKVNVKLVIDLYQSVNSKISHMQLAQLLQVFASLSNIVENEEMQIELLSTCIGPIIDYFSKYQNYFDSVESFIIFNGFELAPCNNFDSEEREDIRRRKSLRCYLTAVEGVLQQVQENSPLGRVDGVIVQLLPVFFKLNKVVLELASQRALSNMHPGYHSISDMTRSERETIYCSVGESLEIQLGKLEAEKKDTAELSKHYVHQLSMQCVNIIALISAKFGEQLHSHPQSAEMLMSTVNVINLMPAFRVRHWIRKTWKNLITSTPQERWNQLVPFVEALTGHMKERLDEMWKAVSAIDYDAEPTEAELFNEHMTCVLAREYLTTIRMIYLGTDAGNQNEVVMTPLGHWLFTQQIGLSSVMYTVFTALTWRDTQSSTKSVPICKAFVDQLVERYDDETAVNMFYHSLNSLQIHGGDEVAGAPLLSLVAHIYVSLRRFSDSFPRVLLEVPGVTESDIAVLDQKVKAINCGEENLPEKKRREMLRKMLQSIISVSTSELHRRPVYLRPLPPIEKRRKEETSPDYEAVSVLFSNC